VADAAAVLSAGLNSATLVLTSEKSETPRLSGGLTFFRGYRLSSKPKAEASIRLKSEGFLLKRDSELTNYGGQ